jgi:hypothetical protein
MNQDNPKDLKPPQAGAAGDPTKAELERQMEEIRESLSQTVQEIKETFRGGSCDFVDRC